MAPSFQRLAIVNRGESAMRVIHAVRELNREHGTSVRTIALFTEADRRSMFVREADEGWCIGPAQFVDPADGSRKSTYLDYARLEAALVGTNADAAWVGWGFVAEHAEFADLCDRLGVTFVGPPGEVIRRLGDKIEGKRLCEANSVPVAPWSGGQLDTLEEAKAAAEKLGFPLMLKASAGGGGRGIRKLKSMADLEDVFESARSEALKGFGDPRVFLERMVGSARHVEVQVICDNHGNAWAVGVRDCSVQRRNQKVLEESGSTALSAEQERELAGAAARLVASAGYRNAGTVEFLYDQEARAFSFMEVNARLQVEHPVTEATTGVDLVKLQLEVASGAVLEGDPPPPRGWAIEARLNAEDPARDFMPAPGRILLFRAPLGPGVRVDTGVAERDVIAPEFDSMIAKIIAWGSNRDEALGRLRRALDETTVVIDGGTTNKAFLLAITETPQFSRGELDIGWLERDLDEVRGLSSPYGAMAVLAAAVEAADAERQVAVARFKSAAARGRPGSTPDVGYVAELTLAGNVYKPVVFQLAPDRYRVVVDGRSVPLRVERFGEHERRIGCGDRSYRVVAVKQGVDYLVEVENVPHRISRDDRGLVRAPAPAVVLSVNVEPGQVVQAGDRVVVVEAMKMEMPVPAPLDGIVREVHVTAGVQVEAGARLLTIEPVAGGSAQAAAPTIDFAAAIPFAPEGDDVAERGRRSYRELAALVLGYDIDADDVKRLISDYQSLAAEVADDDAGLIEREEKLLGVFADLLELFRRRSDEDGEALTEGLGAEEHLITWLRTLDDNRLPESFRGKLERALRHYGVASLDEAPDRFDALMYLFKSHAALSLQSAPITAVLRRWLRLADGDHRAALARPAVRSLLERVVIASRGRLQTVSDLARMVRYEAFEQPDAEAEHAAVYAWVDAALADLDADPNGADRERLFQTVVSCSQPMVGRLLPGLGSGRPVEAGVRLEALIRRYYRARPLREVHFDIDGGRPFASALYDHEGKQIHAFSLTSTDDALPGALGWFATRIAGIPADDDVVVDVFLRDVDDGPGMDALADRYTAILGAAPFTRRIRRIVLSVPPPAEGSGMRGSRPFTFRPDNGGYTEERVFRGQHPMMAKRLQLWRLANFDIERIPSVEDVYLLRGVARGNPSDERLFAFVEVRDSIPLRDEATGLVRLPTMERMVLTALASIREEQSRRAARDRLYWNRVYLQFWHPVTLPLDDIARIVRRIAPETVGLGIEKVVAHLQYPYPDPNVPKEWVIEVSDPEGGSAALSFHEPHTRPLMPLQRYEQNVIRARARGLTYPYEIVRMLTPQGSSGRFPQGSFTEYDIDDEGSLVPVDRPYGQNTANMVVGLISNVTAEHPEGMERVILIGDPTRQLCSLAEPECRRVIGALDLAEQRGIPVEWFAVSAGARIAMDSGTENLDWTARVIRRLVEFTQDGGEVNVIVCGINVGAQSYWNAEATMLMHTRGILVMTEQGAMVLTGKEALSYSGSVSADTNFGIGGYERIMGPNGQAQYWAADIGAACEILLRHYALSYVAPGERFPRKAPTTDPVDRDVRSAPHGDADGVSFVTVGDVFSDATNPGRKKPFLIRKVMSAVVDQDTPHLERWGDQLDGETAVVWDARLGGHAVCVVGIESRSLQRTGFLPADGPERWSAGTLFPQSSKKVARALNSASGNRPAVILANLSGFDGSPESMRKLQLEYGAEIGRSVVNFDGPIVFCVISRYHGGAYVVFSNTLNDDMVAAALEGSYASVIGGAPAAAVVFAGEVRKRTAADLRVREFEARIAAASPTERPALRAQLAELTVQVKSETIARIAEEFDGVHTVQRAKEVGSIDHILPPADLRPFLIDAVERGMARVLSRE